MTAPKLEVYDWHGNGYKPLIASDGWLVALLNWEPNADLEKAREIEAHFESDEVFVLLCGKAALYLITKKGFEVVEVQPGRIYNVCRATWHGVINTRDATWLIVENRDVSEQNSAIRPLTEEEKRILKANAPDWARQV